jgi:hypothetical protein
MKDKEEHNKNASKLRKAYADSPFDDLKVFVPPNVKATVEEVTEVVLNSIPQLVALHSGAKKAEYNF